MDHPLISNLSKYVRLTGEEAGIIHSLFQPRKFRKHQFILQEGDTARYESYIVKGLTRTYEVDEKGQEHVVQFGLEDWWIGDMYSFLTGSPTRVNIDCLEDTEVLQISKANQELLFEQVPKLERHFRIMVQNAFIASTRRITSTLMKPAAERYQEFITTYPQLQQRLANHQIASYLGITPQSLSRIRARSISR